MTPVRGLAMPDGHGWLKEWCLLAALALALRLVHFATIYDNASLNLLILDPRMYHEWAQQIAAGAWIGQRAFFQDPLYAYVLAAAYAIGAGPTVVQALQLLAGACVAPLLSYACAGWYDRATGRVAGVIAACYLPSIYYEGILLKTALGLLLASVTMALFSRAARSTQPLLWLAGGVILGLTTLNRGNVLILLAVIVVWVVIDRLPLRYTQPAGSDLPRLHPTVSRAALLTVVGCCGVLLFSLAHNRIASSSWILTTSNGGQNFYLGNNPLNQTGQYARLPFVDPNPKHEERGFRAEAERRSGRSLTAKQVSRFWFAQSLSWVREDPVAWSRLMWRKFRVFWSAFEVPDNLDYYLYRKQAPILRLPLPGFGLLAPLAMLGAALTWRRPGWPRLVLLWPAIYSLTVVAFFVFSRFRMTMMPALFVLAGVGLVEGWRRLRQRSNLRRALWPLALFLLAAAFVNLPVRAAEQSWSYRFASALGLPRTAETSATAHFNRGVALAAEAKTTSDPAALLRQAEAELRLAVADEQRYADPFVELGKVLARLDRNREAIEPYRRALSLEPRDYRTHHALGILHRRLGDTAEAAAAFHQALRLEPRHVASAVALGQTLAGLGRVAEATEAFRHALKLDPGNARARAGLEELE